MNQQDNLNIQVKNDEHPASDMLSEKKNRNTARTLKKTLKWAAIIFTAMLTVGIAGIGLIGFTHTGNNWLWRLMTQAIPELRGELISGHLGTGWIIRSLTFKSETMVISADEAALTWNLSALLRGKIKIDQLSIHQPTVYLSVETANNQDPSSPLPDSIAPQIPIPLEIDINAIQMTGLHFRTPSMQINLNNITSAASLSYKNGLTLKNTDVNALDIVLTPTTSDINTTKNAANTSINRRSIVSSDTATHKIDATAAILSAKTAKTPMKLSSATISNISPSSSKSKIILPSVTLPFPINMPHLLLEKTTIQQGETREEIEHFFVNASAQQQTITLKQLELVSKKISASIAGTVKMQGNYALSSSATINTNNLLPGQLEKQDLTLDISGSLSDLSAAVQATGNINALLVGKLKPLQPELPFNFQVKWQPLQWPPISHDYVMKTDSGSISVKGSLKSYQLTLNTVLHVPQAPDKIALSLDAKGDTHTLSVKKLAIQTLEGISTLEGLLAWNDSIKWQGKFTTKNLNLTSLAPELPEKLTGYINHSFEITKTGWYAKLPSLHITGQLKQHPLFLQGALFSNSSNYYKVDHLTLKTGHNNLYAHGSITNNKWDMSIKFNGEKLNELYTDLAGQAKLKLKLAGDLISPEISYSIQSPQLSYQNNRLSQLNSQGNIRLDHTLKTSAKLTLGQFSQGNNTIKKLVFNASGNKKEHTLSLNFKGNPVAGDIQITGGIQNNQWQGYLNKALFDTTAGEVKLKSPLRTSFNLQQKSTYLANQCWLFQDASLCLKPLTASLKENNTRLVTEFELNNVDLKKLKPYLPEKMGIEGIISSKGTIKLKTVEKTIVPNIDIDVKMTPGRIISEAITEYHDGMKLTAHLNKDQLSAALNFNAKKLGYIGLNLSVSDPIHQQKLKGSLQISHMLVDIIKPLIPDSQHIAGSINAKTQLSGTLKRPQLNGYLRLKDGQFITHSKTADITALSTIVLFQGNHAQLNGRLKVNSSDLKIKGKANWKNMPVTGNITVKGDQIKIRPPEIGLVAVSPDIHFSFGKTFNLNGNIGIPEAKIKIKSLPKSAVEISPDVYIVQSETDLTSKKSSFPFYMNLGINLGNDVHLEAFGLKTDVKGHLKIRQNLGSVLTGDGTIELDEGSYTSMGQDLVINHGTIIFSGPLDSPYLSVEAVRNLSSVEDNVNVGLRISGPVAKPELVVFSEPAMSQQNQWSYLLMGRALNSDSETDQNALEGMLIGFGVSQFSGALNSVGAAIGVEDVAIETEGNGSDTQITIRGYIAPNLQIQYGMGVFDSVSELKARYEILPSLYLQTVSGISQALDIFYQFKI